MRKKYILVIVITSLLIASCARSAKVDPGGEEPPPLLTWDHAAIEILSRYQDTDKNIVLVIPYIVNLYALDLLRTAPTENILLIKDYIQWYLDHLNYPDKYGLTGSMYDYDINRNFQEESREDMDSVDSYSATFIMLVLKYLDLSGDRTLIQSNRSKLEDIIFLVPYLQQPDRLTIALPGHGGKYLMDNCESLGGIAAFITLADKMGWTDIADFYRNKEPQLRQAIEDHFYNAQNGNYDWVIDGTVHTSSTWEKFYPDAYAQLFPIFFQTFQNSSRRKHLWDTFHQFHGATLDDMPPEQQVVYQWAKEVYENN